MNRFPPKRILTAVDFTIQSIKALECAKILGESAGAFLDVVYVCDFGSSLRYGGHEVKVPAQELEELRGLITRDLKRATQDYPTERLRTQILTGNPRDILSQLSRCKDYDLVVMGTHGYTGIEYLRRGSVAEFVVRESQSPVLTLHREADLGVPRKLLVPMNKTEYADRALRFALQIVEHTGAEISILNVVNEPSEILQGRKILRSHLNRLLGHAHAAKMHLQVRDGSPDRVILDEAQSGGFDMVVLSAHKKPFWRDWTLGTTAERVLRHCPIPVLAVPSVGSSVRRRRSKRRKV